MAEQRNRLNAADVERRLQRLRPKPSTVDRDRLMYLAGQQSNQSSRQGHGWFWKSATVLSTSAAVLMALVFADTYQQLRVVRAKEAVSEDVNRSRFAGMPYGQESANRDDLVDTDYSLLALRESVMRQGVDALPVRTATPSRLSSISYWDQIRALDEVDKFAGPVAENVEPNHGLWGQVIGWGENL